MTEEEFKKMSVVLMLHADEADYFLTCCLCNFCLKIDHEHHSDNLSAPLKIKYCDKPCERCKSIRDNQRKSERWFYTDRDWYIHCNSGWSDMKLNDTSRHYKYCFCPGCGFEKDDPDEKFCTGCGEDCGKRSQ